MEIEVFSPGEFDSERHYYPRTLNAQIHPQVAAFLKMSVERVISRYTHLHPRVDPEALRRVLTTEPRHLRWSGSDIFNVSTEEGVKQKLVIETNSCPSGQKSFPLLEEHHEEGGYWRLLEHTFLPLVSGTLRKADREGTDGIVAVLFDKNRMEASGYAQVLATLIERPVHLVPALLSDEDPPLVVRDRELYVRMDGAERKVLCAFRYVTQRPWTRLPLDLKTPLLNPVVACLAGGRNKTTAAKAYEMFNSEYRGTGLEILTPESFTNVRKQAVPLRVEQLGGRAVVKVPYLNAGQGIFTIVNKEELDAFMAENHPYDEFIVQQLVGNHRWSSEGRRGKVFNIGTVPDKKSRIYVFDLRLMVGWQGESFAPIALYARRAPRPMEEELHAGEDSWSVLGTNLSIRLGADQWDTEPGRLLMMDRRDFARLGLGLDDLIDAYVQAVCANQAIDTLARRLTKRGGGLRRELFRSLNNDQALLDEIAAG
ncbi:MAG: hypothetical protein P1V51_02840 [Deltaproteobacteria bacterium]|nr:hypothetical protein [Deltaproteobacteria bacterium]